MQRTNRGIHRITECGDGEKLWSDGIKKWHKGMGSVWKHFNNKGTRHWHLYQCTCQSWQISHPSPLTHLASRCSYHHYQQIIALIGKCVCQSDWCKSVEDRLNHALQFKSRVHVNYDKVSYHESLQTLSYLLRLVRWEVHVILSPVDIGSSGKHLFSI